MQPPSLPAELLYHTFRLIDDQGSLHTLLFVSRLFYLLAEPLLYFEASLRPPACASASRFELLLDLFSRQLAANDGRLALCVRQIALVMPRHVQPTFERTLYPLSRLRRLWLSCEAFPMPVPIPSRCRFMLTHLTWHAEIDHPVEAFVLFLRGQPLLEHLDLLSARTTIVSLDVPDTTLARLRVLKAPLPIVLNLLAGRNIAHVETELRCAAPRAYDETTSEAIGKLKSLAWSAMDFEALSSFAVHLKDLERMKLRIQRGWMLCAVPDLIQGLPPLTSVKYVRLSIGPYLQYKQKGLHCREIANRMFSAQPSLHTVEFENEVEVFIDRYPRDGRLELAETNPVTYPWDPWWCH